MTGKPWGCDAPLAAAGLISYRYPSGICRWIMIGATDHQDALREANRSLSCSREDSAELSKLQIWNGSQYVNIG